MSWSKNMSEQPVTFESLIDALRAKEEVISEEEVLRFTEALAQQVRALRERLEDEAKQYRSPFYTITKKDGEHMPEDERVHIAEVLDAVRMDVTALLGKP